MSSTAQSLIITAIVVPLIWLCIKAVEALIVSEAIGVIDVLAMIVFLGSALLMGALLFVLWLDAEN